MVPGLHRMRMQSNEGFTLVELTIGIIIVSILIAIAVPSIMSQREESRTRQTEAKMRAISIAVSSARADQMAPLRDITGSTCSDCPPCRGAPLPKVGPAFEATACGTRWLHVVGKLQPYMGIPGVTATSPVSAAAKARFTDAWGRPILIDENEDEATYPGFCANGRAVEKDIISSAGPKGVVKMNHRGDGNLTVDIPLSGSGYRCALT